MQLPSHSKGLTPAASHAETRNKCYHSSTSMAMQPAGGGAGSWNEQVGFRGMETSFGAQDPSHSRGGTLQRGAPPLAWVGALDREAGARGKGLGSVEAVG